MKLVANIESVDYQGASKLSRSMVELFSEAMTYRNSLRKNNRHVVDEMLKWCDSNLAPRFTKIMKDLGFGSCELKYSQCPSLAFMVLTQFNIESEDDITIVDIMSRMRGRGQMPRDLIKSFGMDIKSYDELMKIAKQIDRESSQVRKNAESENLVQQYMSVVITFDPYCAFLAKETMSEHIEELTAAEVAAIMIHELGHTMSFIEHAYYAYHRYESFESLFRNFNVNAPVKEQVKLIRHIKSLGSVADGPQTEELEKNILDEKVLKKVEDDVAMTEEVTGVPEKVIDKINDVFRIGISIFIFAFKRAVILPSGLITVIRWPLDLFSIDERFGKKWQPAKNSDLMDSVVQNFPTEAMADEFVTRHGLSGPLGSGLGKLQGLASGLHIGFYGKLARESKLLYNLNMADTLMMNEVMSYGMEWISTYETDINRVHRIKRSTIAALRHPEIPDEMKDCYISQIEDIDRTLKKLKAQKSKNSIDKFITLFFKVSTMIGTGKIRDAMSGGFQAKYAEMVRASEKLIDNPLHYRHEQMRKRK